MVTMETAAT